MAEVIIHKIWIIEGAAALLGSRKCTELTKLNESLRDRLFPGVSFTPTLQNFPPDADSSLVTLWLHADFDFPTGVGSVWAGWMGNLVRPTASADVSRKYDWQLDVQEYTQARRNHGPSKTWKHKDLLAAVHADGELRLDMQLKILRIDELLKSRDLLCRLLCNSEDFQIKVNDKIIKVHQSVLIESSPFFAGMLVTEMREKRDKCLDLANTASFESVDALVKAAYHASWDFRNNLDLTLEVLELSERFQFENVKLICEEALVDLMTSDNVLQILFAADRFRAVPLKSKCIEFIADNDGAIVESEQWNDFAAKNETKDLALNASVGVIKAMRNKMRPRFAVRRSKPY